MCTGIRGERISPYNRQEEQHLSHRTCPRSWSEVYSNVTLLELLLFCFLWGNSINSLISARDSSWVLFWERDSICYLNALYGSSTQGCAEPTAPPGLQQPLYPFSCFFPGLWGVFPASPWESTLKAQTRIQANRYFRNKLILLNRHCSFSQIQIMEKPIHTDYRAISYFE